MSPDEADGLREDAQLIAELATEWMGLPDEEQVYGRLAFGLSKVLGSETIVSVSDYSQAEKLYRPRAIVGLDSFVEKIVELFGAKPRELGSSFPESVKAAMATGRLTRLEGGVLELTRGALPEAACTQAVRLFGLEDVFVIGFGEGRFVGGVVIVARRKGLSPRANTVEALARLAAATLARRRAEDARQESERRFRALFDHSSDLVYLHDLEGRFLEANPAALRLLGYSAADVRTLDLRALLGDAQLPAASKVLEQLMRTGAQQGTSEYRLRRKDGTEVVVETNSLVVDDGRGQRVILGIGRNVTDRRTVERELEAAERKFRSVFEQSPVGKSLTLPDGTVTVNAAFCRLLGYSAEELRGKNWRDLTHPDDITPTQRTMEAMTRGEASEARFEKRYLRKDGSTVWTEVSSALQRDDGGRPEHFITAIVDITDRKASEARLRAMLDASPFPVALVDLEDERILYWSRSATDLFGHTAPSTPEWYRIAYPDPDYRREVIDRWKSFLVEARRSSRPVNTGEYRVTCRDGSVRTCELYAMFLADSLVVTFNDVTERNQVEAERQALQASLAQSDRLASMGVLAAGVAHEINNPLTFILDGLETLARELPELLDRYRRQAGREGPDASGDALLARLQEALGGVRRIGSISRSLGSFSKSESAELEPVDVQACVEHALTMANNELRCRARVVRQFSPAPAVLATDGKLCQVFLNLLVNAAHAIEAGRVEDHEVRIRLWPEGASVLVEVSDTGRGIPLEHQARVFEPFFTTKAAGTGLGLSICKRIVSEFGGQLTFTSRPGEGTCFRLALPKAPEGRAERRPAPAPREAPRGVRGRVLVVDDEAGIRDTLVRILGHDHEVLTAGSGVAAKALLEQDRDFDLVLCDLMMPQMTGMQLHAWLAAEEPRLARRVVFVSGGAFTPGAAEYVKRAGNTCVQKPFDRRAVRALADERVRAARAGR